MVVLVRALHITVYVYPFCYLCDGKAGYSGVTLACGSMILILILTPAATTVMMAIRMTQAESNKKKHR